MVIKVSADLLNDHFPTAGRRPLALHMEEREKAKQIGALSPQSGNEAAEMDILNLFQTLALNHCFFYTVEKLSHYRCIDRPLVRIKNINYGTITVEMGLK